MHRRAWPWILLACGLILITVVPVVWLALAQEPPGEGATMPAGWESLSAGDFAAAAETLFSATPGPTAEHVKEVVAHAWNTFLNDGGFIGSGDRAAVQKLLGQFVPRRSVLVEGNTPAERAASEAALAANVLALKSRLETRIGNDPQFITGSAFGELTAVDDALLETGFTQAEQAELFSDWMDANAWQTLSMKQQAELFGLLSVDELSHSAMSVRWTGFIEAPATGSYTFRQVRQHLGDPATKLSVGGQVVLDSTPVGTGPSPDALFQSQPVAITAGEKVPIQVELIQDTNNPRMSPDYVMAVFTWESAQVPKQVIPTSALTPPAGFGEAGATGLKGEYFAGVAFEPLKATRLDPGLELIWNSAPVVNVYQNKRAQILAENYPKLTDDVYLGGIPDAERVDFMASAVSSFADDLTASKRSALSARLAQHARLLEVVNPSALGKLVKDLFMLPGKEHLALIGAWGEARPTPRSEIGLYPGEGEDRYLSLNYNGFEEAGRYLSGPFWPDTETLWEEYLERPGGECNLSIAELTAFAARLGNSGNLIRDRLDEALAGEGLTGDKRASWLIARAYAEEVTHGGIGRPTYGMDYLDEAFAVAESSEYRFWVLEEIVSRLVSVDRGEKAKSLLDSVQGQFPGVAEQAAMAEWREKADQFAAIYVTVRSTPITAPHDTYVKELFTRLDNARARNDEVAINRYESMLQGIAPPD